MSRPPVDRHHQAAPGSFTSKPPPGSFTSKPPPGSFTNL
jgi:hypothetical protein